MTVDAILKHAINEIRASDALVVIGAGASFQAGMPLAGQLGPLVWHTLENSPIVLNQVCERLGVAVANAKHVVGDDWDRLCHAFEFIAADATARQTFQTSVIDLDNSRSRMPSTPHTALARLIFANVVLGVISLNWDTLLENAFQNRYGFWPFGRSFDLWKPHGDCNRPTDDWILPHQPGIVPDSIVQRVTELAEVRPRVLLIVGYSERDETVVERLIAPLLEKWRVFRISPSAAGEGAIQLDAGMALTALAAELVPERDIPGWLSVSFANQRGIEAAVAGERLGPGNVVSCPRLPHFETALQQLDVLNKIHIAGASGSGKSITVWQLAHHYNKLGWHVIRPDLSTNVTETDRHQIDFVRSKRWPTVVVVDDTQLMSYHFLEDLLELSDDRTKLILGTTDADWEREQTFRISASAAVQLLAEVFRARRDEILPIVQRLDSDSHVGDDFLSTRIEDRIAIAANSETPWQFAYAVRGGWRETRQILDVARDFEENDLLLTAVAVRQLVSLDAGASLPQLIRDAHWLGRDDAWVRSGIQRLESRRFLLCGDSIRCLHQRSAAAIVDFSLNSRSGETARGLMAMIRSVVSEPEVPLRGISWLLHEIRLYRSLILTPETKRDLLQRCFNAHSHIERRDASFVVACLLGGEDSTTIDILGHYDGQIRTWIVEATGEDAYGIGSMVNNLFNDHNEECKRFLDSVEPRLIAEKLSSLDTKDAYAWGYFLGRLSVGSPKEWGSRVSKYLPREDVRQYVAGFSAGELEELSNFIKGIAGFDFDFALECYECALGAYKTKFADDALAAYHSVDDLEDWVLGNPWFGKARPTKRQSAIAKSMFDAIEPETIVKQILACPFGDWEYYARLLSWVRRVHPKKIYQIVDVMNWDELDIVIGEMWAHPPRELRLLLFRLIKNNDGEPIRSWVAARSSKIDIIDPILAGTSPEAAISVARNGKRVDFGDQNGTDWDWQTWAIARIATVDEDVAKAVLRQNKAHFAKGLKEMSFPEEGLPKCLDLIHELDDEILPEVISVLDPADVQESWTKALQDHRQEKRHAVRRTLRKIISVGNTAVCDLADELLRSVRYRKTV